MKKTILFFLACTALAALNASAATVRLVYGEKWSKAGREVKKTLESQAWKSLAKSSFKVELIDEEKGRPEPQNLGSIKLPAIFVLDEKDRCYCVIENVPMKASAEWIYRQVSKATELKNGIEKKFGTNTPDGCGQLMYAMERFVGGDPKRVISKGFYQDVYEKLKTLDPNDKEGWLRHFTMPFVDHEGKSRTCNHADGVEIVEEATWYRKEGKVSDGERFIEQQKKLPRQHLTKEQQQSLLMAQFALYAPADMNKPWTDPKKAEMVKLLEAVAKYDEQTLWGTAALGWLACPAIGQPAFSTYWGWKRGDIPSGRFDIPVKYGVSHAFRMPGEYTITPERLEGAAIKFDSITLYKGDEEVAKLTREPFVVKIERRYAGKLTHMVLKGTSGGECSGKFNIKRTILKPRKEAK